MREKDTKRRGQCSVVIVAFNENSTTLYCFLVPDPATVNELNATKFEVIICLQHDNNSYYFVYNNFPRRVNLLLSKTLLKTIYFSCFLQFHKMQSLALYFRQERIHFSLLVTR